MYERMHPDTIHGKASKKKKDSGTESFRPLPYLAVAAQQLGKSRATIWKYLCIYNHLVQGHPAAFAELKKCDHPILSKLEELQELAKSQDLTTLTRLMCGEGMLPGDRKHQPCTFQDARTRLAQYRAKEAREKDQSQVQGKGNAGEELPPQPPETPSHSSTLPAPTSSSALEMSAPQPPDSTTTPPPEGGSVATSPPETPACVDPLPDEALDTVEDVLRALDEQINTYLRAMNLFNVFHIGIEKTSNEIHVTVQERA